MVDAIPIARVLVRRAVVVNDSRVLSQVAQIVVAEQQRILFKGQAFQHQDDVEHGRAAEAGEEAARPQGVGREAGEALAHGTPEVGAEDEDVEARGARHLVVQVARGGVGEADAGVGRAFAVVDGDGPLLLGAEVGSRQGGTEGGDGVRDVEAEEELCIVAEVGGAPFQVPLARAVRGGQVVHVGLEILARAAQLGQREVGDAADESQVGARSADDPVREEAALEVVGGEEGGRGGEAAGAESEFPAEIGGVVDGGVEAEGAEDAMHVALDGGV